jgi:hypothetical protein
VLGLCLERVAGLAELDGNRDGVGRNVGRPESGPVVVAVGVQLARGAIRVGEQLDRGGAVAPTRCGDGGLEVHRPEDGQAGRARLRLALQCSDRGESELLGLLALAGVEEDLGQHAAATPRSAASQAASASSARSQAATKTSETDALPRSTSLRCLPREADLPAEALEREAAGQAAGANLGTESGGVGAVRVQ